MTVEALAAMLARSPYNLPAAEIDKMRPHLEAEAARLNAIIGRDPRFRIPLGETDVSLTGHVVTRQVK